MCIRDSLKWDAVTGATGYELYVVDANNLGTALDTSGLTINNLGTDLTPLFVANPGVTDYIVNVRVKDDLTQMVIGSSWSENVDVAGISVIPTPDITANNITLSNDTGKTILDFTPDVNATSYIIKITYKGTTEEVKIGMITTPSTPGNMAYDLTSIMSLPGRYTIEMQAVSASTGVTSPALTMIAEKMCIRDSLCTGNG